MIYLIIIVVLVEGGGIVDNPRFTGRIHRKTLIKTREKKRWISGVFRWIELWNECGYVEREEILSNVKVYKNTKMNV